MKDWQMSRCLVIDDCENMLLSSFICDVIHMSFLSVAAIYRQHTLSYCECFHNPVKGFKTNIKNIDLLMVDEELLLVMKSIEMFLVFGEGLLLVRKNMKLFLISMTDCYQLEEHRAAYYF